MFPRAIAFLLAFVMLWSPPAVQEQAFAAALGTGAPASSLHAGPAEQPHGSAASHPIKDNLPAPGQAHAEAAFDAQEMLTEAAVVAPPGTGAAWPQPGPALARLAPYLDGPQRPPCASRFPA